MKNIFTHIYTMLAQHYGKQNWWPIVKDGTALYQERSLHETYSEAEVLEIVVGAILTQNTNWNNVVKALSVLKRHNMLNIDALEGIVESKLANMIKSSGYFNQKAKKIKHFIRFIRSELQDDIYALQSYRKAEVRTMLLGIWGIGPETADTIALYGYNFTLFVVDNYTKRLFSRLGLIHKDTKYDEIQSIFSKALHDDTHLYKEYHALIVTIGKEVCKSQPQCDACVLNTICKKVL